MPEVRIALIGCGGMGRAEAQRLAGIPGARLVACCDVAAEAAERAGRELGVAAHTDAGAVLASPEVDGVIVATPNGLHTELVCAALQAGKHVFCEKPMAFTVAECDRMAAEAERAGRRLMVGHVLRLMPVFQRVIDIVDAGSIGRPVSAEITRIGWLGDPSARYRLRRDLCGGLLYDITVHEIDFMHRLCGATERVYALMDRFTQTAIDYEDTVHLLLRHRDGAQSHIFAALSAVLGRHRGTVIGDAGTLHFDLQQSEIEYRPNAGEAVRERVSGGEDGYVRELRSFVEWVQTGAEPLLTWREGRAAIAVAEAAYRSAAEGVPVEPAP